ncbi:MAG TPA: 4Fe-4S dicluster domain-containing protein [Candidatus Binatia bacterium]|jgi:Fe-S-cluster-containing dehydrogenase component/formate-dependent nitrite reductase membrane component NrfD|nr:4Fe-4S dicluster domain-containing protein [Candidatus Binatia bacterium]
MRYGFVIDQNRCIGCHACTVACKEEHNIAVGVNRTWVKYIEKGRYPDTRRHFAVLRCNHCDDAPCIEICPTVALFRRADGIVDFDHERCIGCKSCMQACPYDALYIDPERNTAAKCNFDASRVEMGYKPACEVVCPTQAILSGDLDDPNSLVSKRIALEKVSVRKPEKGTKPKLFYVGVDGDLLNPTMMEPQTAYFWADKDPGEDLYALKMATPDRPIPGAAREVYDVPHILPWGKKIASYLWTKSISAGVLLMAALFLNMGFEQDAVVLSFISPVVSLLFLAATMSLLVLDLKKPGRFLFLLTKPNLNSWLVLGGYVLLIFGILLIVWLIQIATIGAVSPLVIWATALFAIASAGYSAFLFAQARGRDFWQSPLLFWHLLVQAIVAGAAIITLIGTVFGVTLPLFAWLGHLLVISLFASLAMILGELFMKHGAEEALRSGELLLSGALSKSFWVGVVGLGTLVPIGLTFWQVSSVIPNVVASLFALFGLWMYEHLWIKAGQAVPLS